MEATGEFIRPLHDTKALKLLCQRVATCIYGYSLFVCPALIALGAQGSVSLVVWESRLVISTITLTVSLLIYSHNDLLL